MVMVVVMDFTRRHKACHGILVAGCVAQYFTAFAHALIRLNVRAGGHLLQEYLNRFFTRFAFEGQDAGWFIGHDVFSE
jgi:hypothetical protein